MLKVRDLDVYYGNIHATKGISLSVGPGEFVAVLGPNGAGKSTLLKAIAGVHRQRSGTIELDGVVVDALGTASRIRRGLGAIPEGRQLFPDMTVRENLILGAYARLGLRITAAVNAELDGVFDLFPRLRERRDQLAGSLSGGEAQMVAIARALMARPRLLLCDEPSLGLAPLLVREMLSTLGRLRERGITVLMADQNALAALRLADRGYIIDTGQIAAQGSSASLLASDRLRSAYLGEANVGRPAV